MMMHVGVIAGKKERKREKEKVSEHSSPFDENKKKNHSVLVDSFC